MLIAPATLHTQRSTFYNALGFMALATRLNRLADSLFHAVNDIYAARTDLPTFKSSWFVPFQICCLYGAPVSVGSVADLSGLSHAAVSRAIRDMASEGLLYQPDVDTKGRKSPWTLTPKGCDIADLMEPTWRAIDEIGKELFDDPEQPLLDVLQDCEDNLLAEGGYLTRYHDRIEMLEAQWKRELAQVAIEAHTPLPAPSLDNSER